MLGLTYNFKAFDKFILGLWISYFLFTFRNRERAALKIKDRGATELSLMAPESNRSFNNRTNTSQFIKDVDFAFKGAQVRLHKNFFMKFFTEIFF